MSRIARAITLMGLVSASPATQAFDVVSTDPTPYALHVSQGISVITIVFDEEPVVPEDAAVRVAATMSGLHQGTVTVDGNTVSFTNGATPFLPGDLVSVNLRNDIESAGGTPLTGGHFFAFTIAVAPSNPDWESRTTWATAQRPYFIHGGDLDNDNTPDLALPNEDSNDVSVMLNESGTGSFPSRDDYDVGSTPSSIYGDDLDNDGWQDLASADIASSTLSVLMNNGDGTFAPAVAYPAGQVTRQVHGGDFDGDNDIDLCTTSRNTNQVYLFTNNGDGTFAPGVPYNDVGLGPFAIRTGDFNGDGHLDIGVGNQDSDNLSVLTNDGTGGFTTTGTHIIGNGPWCLNGNDLNGDGAFDLVSVASFGNRFLVLLNNGSGQFPTSTAYITGSFPLGVYAADLDGDGDIDATSSNFSAATVDIFTNLGDGNMLLTETLLLPQAGTYTWAHDLDGDGDLDISTLDELADVVLIYPNTNNPVSVDPATLPGNHPVLSVGPNPFEVGTGTTLRLMGLSGATEVVAEIFSVNGRWVDRRKIQIDGAPSVSLSWDGRDARGKAVGAGHYLIEITAGADRLTRRVQVVR